MEIRRARPKDAEAFLGLVCALAHYEKRQPPDEAAKARLIEDAFGPTPRFELWVAERAAGVCAYAVTFETYSTFLARPSLYLEDLFVQPDARRQGIATALLARLERDALARGCGRFEWSVLDWNTDAQALYNGIGATLLDDWRVVRKVL